MRFNLQRSTGRLHAGLVALAVLLSLVLTAGQARDTLTLYDAIRDARLSTAIRGDNASSGGVVFVDLAKRPGTPLGDIHVRVPPGTILRNGNAAGQSMVVAGIAGQSMGGDRLRPATEMVVSSTTPVTFVLEAYCAEFEKDNPSASDRFTVEVPDPNLVAILMQATNLSIEAKQAAVWMQTDHLTFEHMREKFPVTEENWRKGEAAYQRGLGTVSRSAATLSTSKSPLAGSPPVRGATPSLGSAQQTPSPDVPKFRPDGILNFVRADGFSRGPAVSQTLDGLLRVVDDETITFWNVTGHVKSRTVSLPTKLFGAVSPDDSRVIVGGIAGFGSGAYTVAMHDIATYRELWTIHDDLGTKVKLTDSVDLGFLTLGLAASFSPDGKVVGVGQLSDVILLDASTGKLLHRLTSDVRPPHADLSNLVSRVTFSNDGRLIAAGTADGAVVVWNVSSGQQLSKMLRHYSAVVSVVFSSDGRTLASLGLDSVIKIWDPGTGRELRSLVLGHRLWARPTSIALNSDGRWLVSGATDMSLVIWKLATGEPVESLDSPRPISMEPHPIVAIAVGPDDRWIAAGNAGGEVFLWRRE